MPATVEVKETTLPERTSSDSDYDHRNIPITHNLTGLKRAGVVPAIVSSTFFYALDNTIKASIRPGISKSLGRLK